MDLSTPPSFLAAEDEGLEKSAGPDFPAAGTAQNRALGIAARHRVTAEIPDMVAKLAQKEMTLRECAGRLEEIADQVRKSGDPVASLYFTGALDALAGGASALPTGENQKLVQRVPSLFVEYLGEKGGSWCAPLSRATGDTLGQYLRDVQQKTGKGPLAPGVLKSVAHLAWTAKQGSAEREPPENSQVHEK